MTETFVRISALRRPRLLIRAARVGLAEYKRERDLCRLMQTAHIPSPENAVESLLNEEEALEQTRKEGVTGYSSLRHIEVLIALMGEARLLTRGPVAVT